MSMLAERKIKTKWSLNPRGKAWSQDSNKFGQKMLEKMGWQQGKGLGPDGKGITEHIKATYKNDSKGMGYKESNDQWKEHEDNFTSLLESLNGEAVKLDELKLNSLEKKSETSRARVHYHKFTRGKDLSKYSEKDLANIFGKKTLNESKKEMQEEKSDSNEIKIKYDSTLLLNAGSMRDYFKKKLPNFGKTNGFVVGKNGVLKKEDSESESEGRPGFGFGYKPENNKNNYESVTIKSESTLQDLDTNGNCKSKTKEIAKATFVSYLDVEETGFNKKNKKKRKGEENDEHSVLSPKKKSKKNDEKTPKNKLKIKVDKSMGLSNPAFNPLPTPVKVQKHVLNTIQESISENSASDENSPKTIEVEAEVYGNTPKEQYVIGEQRETPKKKKKKTQNIEEIIEAYSNDEKKTKKIVNGFVNDVSVEDIESSPKKKTPKSNTISEDYTGTKENSYGAEIKKKKKNSKLAIDNPNFEDTTQESINTSQIEENPYEVKIKKKKKKKDEQYALENPNFNATLETSVDSSQCEVNPYEVKVTKKKKKVKEDKFALSNPSFNELVENGTDSSHVEENPYEVKVKNKNKKKQQEMDSSTSSSRASETSYEIKNKKKKKKKEVFAIDNPHFDANDTEVVDTKNNMLEVERKKKKSKKVQEGGIINPALNLDTSQPETEEVDTVEVEESDIMLNVVTTPIIAKPRNENIYSITKVNSVKRTKSVRFSNVTQERIIPNNDELRNATDNEIGTDAFLNEVKNGYSECHSNAMDVSPLSYDESRNKRSKKRKLGLDNVAFDEQKNTLEENLDSISKTIDMYQAEVENDINEKKLETFRMEEIMVGEVGNPHGENERVPDGSMLKFKYAHFKQQTPFYILNKTGSKKSYKHLIKGDIVIKFQNSNLHEIDGYAVKKKSTV